MLGTRSTEFSWRSHTSCSSWWTRRHMRRRSRSTGLEHCFLVGIWLCSSCIFYLSLCIIYKDLVYLFLLRLPCLGFRRYRSCQQGRIADTRLLSNRSTLVNLQTFSLRLIAAQGSFSIVHLVLHIATLLLFRRQILPRWYRLGQQMGSGARWLLRTHGDLQLICCAQDPVIRSHYHLNLCS